MTRLHIVVCLFFFFAIFATSLPESFNCGGLNNLTYPISKSTNSSHYYGYPDLDISCFGYGIEIPLLFLLGHAYIVKNVNYSKGSITLVPYQTMYHHSSCIWPTHDVILGKSGSLVYAEGTNTLIFYSNCSHIQPELPKMRCSGDSSNQMRSYRIYNSTPSALDWECESRALNPLLHTATERLRSSDWQKAMTEGFELLWHPDTACKYCEKSGGLCGYYNDPNGLNFTCSCPDGNHPLDCKDSNGLINIKQTLIMGAVAAIGTIVSLILICLYKREVLYFPKKKAKNIQNVEEVLKTYKSHAPRRFKYSDVKKMTNSFKDKLGEGGHGRVFKGKLVDGRLVAVKVLNESKSNENEFLNEVVSISRTNHLNVVSLLGICCDGSRKALIYEFMPNGSLDKFIYAEQFSPTHFLGWEKLYQIALGIARGLEYLHRGCNTCILHFDIKPHYILLDQNFCPRISDFGLAKLCPARESVVSMHGARGTVGYIAPDMCCRNIGTVSYKSDVYSYGMMVLEMVGGRKNVDVRMENISEIYFPCWIYKRLERQENLGLGVFEDVLDEEIAKKMVLVGLWCIQTNPTVRPSMNKVVEMLEGSIDGVKMPPKPFFDSPSK